MLDFESCFSPENLSASVQSLLDGHFDVIANRHRIQTGVDRIELIHFLRDQVQHLAAINRKVLSGKYTFRPFLEREIPKPDSTKLRTISIASIRDVVVQRAIYEYLYPVVETRLTPSVFGYRKGTSAHDAVRLVRTHFENGRQCVFDADLQEFFDTVNHDVLLGMVAELSLDERAATLLRRFLKTGRISSSQVEEHRKRKGNQVKYVPEPRTVGVPQGGVLSGLLSNLYLSGFDAVVRQHHDGYIRYADDFLVCCQSKEDCARVHELVKTHLKPLRVQLHPKKTTEFVSATPGVDFLGCRISARGIRVRGRNIQKFKMRIRKIFDTQAVHQESIATLRSIVRRLTYKIRGPSDEQLKALAARGKLVGRCRRSWIGFFRIVDDTTQIAGLDRWIRRQISAFMWKKHRVRVRLSQMQKAGLPSLVNSLWTARANKPPVGS